MSSKQIVIVVSLLLLIGGFVTLFILRANQVPQDTTKTAIVSPTPTTTPAVTLLTWTDEAGFSFQYPEGTVIDKHPEDTKNYANLTLTLPSRETINILMSDNSFKDLEATVANKSALDTILGGVAAKKTFEGDQEVITCIDNGVLVTITGKNVTQIVNSWVFIYPTKTVTGNSNTVPSDGGDVLEEE